MNPLTDAQLDRYARYIVLKDIGGAGQKKLLDAHILIVGAGGIGCPAIQYLAAAGIGALTIVDDDVVSLSNLQRQVLFGENDIGKAKVEVAEVAAKRINPDVVIFPINQRLTAQHFSEDAAAFFAPFDAIIDGTDNYAAGKPPFGNMIALAEQNETMAGWLYDPLTGRICHADKNGGAFLNGDRITVATAHPDRPVAALATGFMTPEERDTLLAAAEPYYEIVDIPRCAAEQYPRLVQGTLHISVFQRTLPWDHASGVLFLNEAGGKCARWDGSDYRPADPRKGLLGTSSPKLWDEAAEQLGDVFNS